ncbi:unnamed protein product [Medioppia subpectinata]|uniref:Lipase domain-containing protein n=1 Tax=Medioppia subpectinata TaxID=1979941 RepID=A0A7R9KCZ7_9ACAR|nr:unnamed protein product [Medioppia subpectinata]CAG2101216.1 unnamed protein product [Medioppia subpectinata]
MLDQFLEFTKCNVIVVDWSKGSNGTYARTSLDNVHILGCSLGAHTAGFVGHALGGKIGRITGLDPARPGFTDPKVDRLNSTNAAFVDVIHSDVPTEGKGLQAGFGINLNVGHIDFWPNDGVGAPDCIVECMKTEFAMQLNNSYTNTDKEKNLLACMSCSHGMAANYYVDSINPDNPKGRAHQNGTSIVGPMYAIIGKKAIDSKSDKDLTKGKSYYLTTKANSPYFYTEN